MKINFVEYDDYYIGFAHKISMSDKVIEYLKEIHIMFLGNKQLFVFLNKYCLVITSENIDDQHIQLDIAGKFMTMQLPQTVGGIHNSFRFDLDDESCEIEARLNVKSTEKYALHLNSCLKLYSDIRFILAFDIIKSQ